MAKMERSVFRALLESLFLTFIDRPFARAVVSRHSAGYKAWSGVYVKAYICEKKK